MGIMLEHSNLVSMHGFRSARRRAAITRRDTKVCDIQKVVSTVEWELANARAQLGSWESWWHGSRDDAQWISPDNALISALSDGAGQYDHDDDDDDDNQLDLLCADDTIGKATVRRRADAAVQTDKKVMFDTNPLGPSGTVLADGPRKGNDSTTQASLEPTITMTVAEYDKALEMLAEVTADKAANHLSSKMEAKLAEYAMECEILRRNLRNIMTDLAEERNKTIALETKVAESNLRLEELQQQDSDVDEDQFDYDCQPNEYYENDPTTDTAQMSDEGLHRNDIGLPTQWNRTVDWVRFFGQGSQDLVVFTAAQGAGHFVCCTCRKDTSKLAGNFGFVWMQRPDGDWEEKHLLDLYVDVADQIRCLRCQRKTIPCKYHYGKGCWRGSACAYGHTVKELASRCHAPAVTNQSFCSRQDLGHLSAASKHHREVAVHIRDLG